MSTYRWSATYLRLGPDDRIYPSNVLLEGTVEAPNAWKGSLLAGHARNVAFRARLEAGELLSQMSYRCEVAS